MKRYLTGFFILLSILILIIGLRTDYQFKGIVSWGLACISLALAAYFAKYIPDEKPAEKRHLNEE